MAVLSGLGVLLLRGVIVNLFGHHDGRVYAKCLGVETADTFAEMTEFNPDDSWALVE